MRKTLNDILYLLNTSFSYDTILIEALFPQFHIIICSKLSLGLFVYATYLICYKNIHYVGFSN